uniref:Cadherin domain-containing protein n=1 Tax=Panagrolaimus sp. JU765 TaxID=591449 RepID=A0AC34RJJ9_9BILA
MESGQDYFHVDQKTGKLYSNKPLHEFSGQIIEIKIWAKDSGGLTSSVPANVQIHVLNDEQNCPHFVKGLYEFTISEDILPGIVIGVVEAVSSRAVVYKIISGNDGRFHLDSKTGKLSVAKEQDADSSDVVLLNIEARASDNCASFSQVRIKVEDQNDNAPEFDMSEVETSVYEDFAIHEPFFAVQAIDKDKHENGKITYELIKSEPACPVIVRPLTGQIVLVGHLDFEKTKRYKLLIRAQDQGIPPKSSFTTIFLNVLDANDHAPEFSQQLYDLEVYENVPLMTTFIALKAKDKDSGENSDVRYRFADDTVTDFGINHKTGELFVKQSLDRETVPEYSFLVIAYDRGNPPMSTNASVHIRVLDVNDNTPNCSTLERMRISDDMEAKQLLGQLNAHDPDAGLNGTVVYSLQQFNEFIDVKKNGEVYLRKKLRGALRSSMQIAVIAEDQGPKPRPVVCTLLIDLDKTESDVKIIEPLDRTVHLNVADPVGAKLLKINATNAFSWSVEPNKISSYFSVDHGIISVANPIDEAKFMKPQPLTIAIGDEKNRKLLLTFIIRLHHSSTPDNETIVVKLQETTAIGSKLFTLSTPEKGNNYYYNVIKSNPSFEVNEATGQVYLAKRLEYNNASIMQLDVKRNSLHTTLKKKDMTLVFELDDVNNHSPVFTNESYHFEVLESTPVGAVIGRVEASDEDFGTNGAVKYRFIDSEETFSIDIETGEIFIQKPLYRHVKPKFYMTVEAEDCATLKDDRKRKRSVVFIDVVDSNNNNPIFLSSTNITIHSKNFNQSEPIHYFVTIDMDSAENAQVKYKLIGGNENNDYHLDSTTGALYMKNLVVGPSKLLVRALDESSTPRFADQSFMVYVDHTATEWKYFDNDSFVIELENVPSFGSTIYEFTNKKIKERVEFHLLPDNQKGFEIGLKDGVLKINGQIRNETHRFIVYAVSGQVNSTDYAVVIVKFKQGTSPAPKIVQSSCGNISVLENRSMKDLMRIFALQNVESESSPLFYHIESGADSLFQINETSGVIFCNQLDREKKSEHFLIISVSDNNVPKRADVCTVRVLVKDENDNIPKFDTTVPDVIEIGSSIVAPALLLKLTATDPDEGNNGKIRFKIIDDPSGSLDIDPDTGDVIFARDYSFSKPEFVLKVAAEDCSRTNPLSSEKQIRVFWKRTTKGFLRGEPKFLQQKHIATVFEGLPKGTPVLKLETSNKIFNDALLTLNIVEGNTDFAFEVDDDGNILTAEELDAEIQNIYTLKIMATGKFVKSAETIVEIHVLDTNDNVPSLPLLPDKTLLENLPVGTLIGSVVANDVDEMNNIEYSLDPVNDYFYISKLNGGIYLKKPLDFEKEKRIFVGIQAFDGTNIVKTNFTVIVEDVNDNVPKFQSDLLKINVPVFFGKNTIIGKVTATDRDQGINGEVSYELLDGTKNLKIDRKTGELQLLSPMKMNSVYFVTVKATDNGTPKLSSVATLKLKPVQNANNQKPKFTKESFTFMVAESYPVHLPFGKVEFTNGSNVALTILSQDYSDVFHISNNGELSLMMKLDRESVKEYRFQVAMNCNEEDSVENDVEVSTIIVEVQDENDNAPIFSSESITIIKLDEQMRKGIIIGRLIATDADAGDNGQVTYSIVSGNEQDVIRIDSHSGAIMFDHWDDECLYENPGTDTFNVTFVAEDNGSPSQWTIHQAQIVFGIENWSGSAPMFVVPLYHKFVAEDSSVGSVVLKVQAHNKWDYSSSNWRYSISGNDEVFDINGYSGEVILKGLLDYEKRINYEFTVTVKDARHRSAIVPVHITVIGVDEFAPIFSKSSYTFEIPVGAEVGQRIGNVLATDDDFGQDGKISYSISDEEQYSFLGIDPDTGVLVLREPLSSNKTTEQVTVIASSGVTQHSRAIVYIEIIPSESVRPSNFFKFTRFNKLTLIIVVLLFAVLFLCCLILTCIYLKTRNQQKPQKQVYSVSRGNVAVMADINRSSPTFIKMPSSLSYERPKTFSLMSSNSSDRNSNPIKSSCTTDNFAARSQPDSGIDPDAISISSSVTDYLLQIGVTPVKLEQLNHFSKLTKSTTAPERIDPELGDLADLIYAKVDEVMPPPRMAMSSYNPVELSIESFFSKSQNQNSQQEGLTYHPLTEVFAQISKMREDQNSSQQ